MTAAHVEHTNAHSSLVSLRNGKLEPFSARKKQLASVYWRRICSFSFFFVLGTVSGFSLGLTLDCWGMISIRTNSFKKLKTGDWLWVSVSVSIFLKSLRSLPFRLYRLNWLHHIYNISWRTLRSQPLVYLGIWGFQEPGRSLYSTVKKHHFLNIS